jgi:hypothetical protein
MLEGEISALLQRFDDLEAEAIDPARSQTAAVELARAEAALAWTAGTLRTLSVRV